LLLLLTPREPRFHVLCVGKGIGCGGGFSPRFHTPGARVTSIALILPESHWRQQRHGLGVESPSLMAEASTSVVPEMMMPSLGVAVFCPRMDKTPVPSVSSSWISKEPVVASTSLVAKTGLPL
jgi:hypothetical protein